jgi:beta-mannosidase
MQKTSLNDGWEFRRQGKPDIYLHHVSPKDTWRPASVPGHVHLDLADNQVIGHPFVGQHEAGCQWIDAERWEYRLKFSWTPKANSPRRVLRFEGLDTLCTIALNGEELAKHENMFVPLEIDVTERLKHGENELIVLFEPAAVVGDQLRNEFLAKEGMKPETENLNERTFVRKAQYMYGWDWGPRLVSCGIWQPVELLEFESRIVSFSVHQERQADGTFRIRTETAIDGPATFKTRFGDHEAQGDLDIRIDSPKLWWPNSLGEAHLYEASAEIPGQKIQKNIGLRTIELVRENDHFGQSFRFRVNEKDLWSRGANWIPNDSFPSKVTREHYQSQIKLCHDLNFNMIRVWGGGLYELDPFYDYCDEFGILVWQDFPYGCCYYPDDEAAKTAARNEAEYQVARLRDRTSLALWCGNNENLTMWDQKWGGIEKSPPRYCGEVIFREVLPEVVERISPQIPYIESSPVSYWPPVEGGPQANEGGVGDQHYWDVWHGRGDWKYYVESTGRFVSEFGFASSCSSAQWQDVLDEVESASRRDATVRWHDKTLKPFEVFSGMVALHYPDTDPLEDWVYYSQLNQRDAFRFGIERFHTSGFCDGALIWQINDCWPVQSWAVQEYSRSLKPAGFELQRLYAQESLAVLDPGDGLTCYFCNEEALHARVQVDAVSTLDGSVLKTFEFDASNTGVKVPTDGLEPTTTALRFMVPDRPETIRWHLLAEPKDTLFGQPSVSRHGQQIHVRGLLFDAILTDPADLDNVPAFGGLTGYKALTIWNEAAEAVFDIEPKQVEVRWLGGKVLI